MENPRKITINATSDINDYMIYLCLGSLTWAEHEYYESGSRTKYRKNNAWEGYNSLIPNRK